MPYTLDESESVADILGFKKAQTKSPSEKAKTRVVQARRAIRQGRVVAESKSKDLPTSPQSR